jgi:PqqD family protein of HPr-rel-A system
MLVYNCFAGTAHVVADLGFQVTELCGQGPQTMEACIASVNAVYEAEDPADLTKATTDAVRHLHALGILTQCASP